MELFDKTKNQHFISQAEQRLNALNPNSLNRNQKIYVYDVDDRENYKLVCRGTKKITTSLSINDLFCFDKIDSNDVQFNFEKLFQRYENDISVNTKSLIDKVEAKNNNVANELISIFVAKFMNFVRNPYSIKKVLNTFPSLLNIHPTDPVLYSKYKQVLEGKNHINKPFLCS